MLGLRRATRTEKIAALGHDLSRCDLVPDATCTQPGRAVGTCARCGVKIDEVIPAKGHDYSYKSASSTEPTCTESGRYQGTCPRCGKEYNDTIPALGHDWGEWVVTQEPTAETTGYRYHLCARCNTREGEDIPKLRDHTWDSGIVTTKPDCIHAGVRTYTCTDCGATKTETIPATGEHTFVTKEIPATCTTGGYILCTCSVCGTTQRYDRFRTAGTQMEQRASDNEADRRYGRCPHLYLYCVRGYQNGDDSGDRCACAYLAADKACSCSLHGRWL